ncbi:MAG: tetratricopeptide repeat protein [Gemmatimonadota bacterium]|nr:tetratricopeptide repeat protein [Gemmatimonadota bacterium]
MALPGLWFLSALPLQAQDLPFSRDYPGAAPYECPAFDEPEVAGAEARTQAAQLASSAAQSVILGDLARAQAMLDRATELDPASADLAYRRARVLEDLGERSDALTEYCRAIALAGDGSGARDAEERLQALVEAEYSALPEDAIAEMEAGLEAVERDALGEALSAFEAATDEAPNWAAAVYNRAVALDRSGRSADASRAFSRYLDLRPEAPDAIAVSRRIGQLQSEALRDVPSPGAALALGVLAPGMGQFYSGRPLGGLTVLTLTGGAVAAGFLIQEEEVRCVGTVEPGGGCPPDQVVSRETSRPYFTASLAAAAGVAVVGAVEAFFSARGRRSRVEASLPDQASRAEEGGTLVGPSLSVHRGRTELTLFGWRFR